MSPRLALGRAAPAAFTLRPARPGDAGAVGAALRTWDLIECAMNGAHPVDHLAAAIARGAVRGDPVWTVLAGAAPVAIGGVTAYARRMGYAWLLGTAALDAAPRALVALSRARFGVVTRGFDRLDNVIPADRTASKVWLSALGFEFGPAFVHVSGVSVLPFRWLRPGSAAARSAREDWQAP